MFLKIKIALALLIFNSGIVLAQYMPVSNQYIVNRHYLSPAFSGITGNFEAFLTYRKDFAGFDGAPDYTSLFASGPVYGNMSLGVSVSKSSVTVFNAFTSQIDYAYHLKITDNQFVHFGLLFEYMENYLDIDYQSLSVQNDPYIMEYGHAFDVGFGLIYSYKTFQAGVAFPRMLESEMQNPDAGSAVYSLTRFLRIHASCLLDINGSLSMEPFIVVDKSGSQPLWYNASYSVIYREVTWLEMHYRQGGIMGLCLGVSPSKKMLLNYSYEFSGTGMMQYSSGNHEISIGFLIGKNSNRKYQKSAFRSQSKQPYYDWIK